MIKALSYFSLQPIKRRLVASILGTSALLTLALVSCAPYQTTGKTISLDPAFDKIVNKNAKIEIIAEGFTWSEGPVWVPHDNYLLFTDVPENTLYRWDEENGLTEFLKPSGAPLTQVPYMRSPGANGLIMGEEFNHIYMANHGQRAIVAMDLKSKGQTRLAIDYEGQRFSSPNDLVLASNGKIFFTDPPFGLKKGDQSEQKELSQNGVYRADPDGFTHLLIDNINKPNGIGLSIDEKTLFVLVTDAENPIVMAYDLDKNGDIKNPRIFYDYAYAREHDLEGAPDGMATANNGNLFFTGPGGVHIVSPSGKLLGLIDPRSSVSNVTIGEKGTRLYMTAHSRLTRIKLNTN